MAVLAEVEPESAAEFIAWVTPTPPGVAETLLETEFEAVTVATLSKVTGIAVGAEEDGDDRQPGERSCPAPAGRGG